MFSPQEFKRYLKTDEAHLNIFNWVETALRPLQSNKVYKDLVQKASGFILSSTVLNQVHDRLYPFLLEGTPGHDLGHHLNDLVLSVVLSNDNDLQSSVQTGELNAGILSGAFHDLATGIVTRYHDQKNTNSHGEVGAYIFFHATKDLLPEPLRLLVAYSIACHTHYQTDFTTPCGLVRRVWKDEIFEEDGYSYRLAILVCRMTDRLSNMGVVHLLRHINATIDGQFVSGGANIGTDGKWYNVDGEAMKVLLKPTLDLVNGKPTVFKHCLGFVGSALPENGINAFNKNDHLIPTFGTIVRRKKIEVDTFIEALKSPVDEIDLELFTALLRRSSITPLSEDHLVLATSTFFLLSKKEQKQVMSVILAAGALFSEYVATLRKLIAENNRFPGFPWDEILSKL